MQPVPKFSVVMPCYNAERFIRATVESVLAQSFVDWELVVVDDGSTDSSPAIVCEIAATDSRIRLITQVNAGVSVARNTGAAATRGSLLAFLDADDVWAPSYLQSMYEFMHRNERRSIGFARVRIVDIDGKPTGSYSQFALTGLTIPHLLSGNPTTTSSNLVVRRSLFEHIGGFAAGLNFAEDQLFILRAGLSGALIEGLDEILVDYRTNPSGLSASLSRMASGFDVMCAMAESEFAKEVTPLVGEARARNRLYLARRAIRLGRPWHECLGFVWQAAKSCPKVVWQKSIRIVPTAGTALFQSISTSSSR